MMPVAQPLPPELREDAFRLLHEALRPGQPATLRDEYPLAFREDNLENQRVVVEDGRVVSHAVFLPVDFQADGVDLRVGLIGSVATHPDYRRKGYAAACLKACEDGIRRTGGSVSVLWSDADEFYGRLGYARAGQEDLFVIPTRMLRRRNDRTGVRTAQKGDEHVLAEIHGTLRARSIRPPQDWRAMLGIPRMTTLVYERDRQVVAYACCGRGADFEGVVHEWAGPTEEALDLVLEHALRNERDDIILLSPPYTGRIRRTLRERGLPAHRGALGMMKVVDPKGLAETVNRFFLPGTSPACSVSVLPDGRFCIRGPFGERIVNRSAMLRAAFGAEEADEAEDALKVPGLPIPLYLRGLDSI